MIKFKTYLLLVFVKSSRHSKLEKADILEMTVKHLRNLQRLQMTGMSALTPISGLTWMSDFRWYTNSHIVTHPLLCVHSSEDGKLFII